MAIDIGTAATDRNTYQTTETIVAKGNPANATGTIDTVEIWASLAMTLCEVATFFVVSGNNLSTRDSEAIGSVAAGSKQTFAGLSMSVTTGDYLGIYFATGRLETSITGDGDWYKDGDNIPTTNTLFTAEASTEYSLYGTGTEPPPPTTQGKVGFMAAKLMRAGAL